MSKSIYLIDQKDFIGSEKLLFEIVKKATELSDYRAKLDAYNYLGITYGELHEYDKALGFYKRCLILLRENKIIDIKSDRAAILNNIGLLYQNSGHHKSAINYFLASLNYLDTSGIRYTSTNDNLAFSKLKSGDFRQLPEQFFQTLKISTDLNFNSSIITCKSNLAEYYLTVKNYNKAIKYASESFHLARKVRSRDCLIQLNQLAIADPQNAPKYAQEYIKISDSLQLAERKMRNKFARIEYETEELEAQTKTLKSQQQTIVYTSIALFLMLLVLVIFGYYVLKNRQLKLKREQQATQQKIYRLKIRQQQKVAKARQKEKQRISKELHDGVMGKLCGIRLSLFMLHKNRDSETIAKSLKCVHELHNIEKEIRAIAYDLYGEIPDVNSIQN